MKFLFVSFSINLSAIEIMGYVQRKYALLTKPRQTQLGNG
jgi:hypothetical protein